MNPAAPVLTGTTYRDAFAQTVDYAARSAVYFGARTAVVDVERGDAGRFDYRAINERACRLARFLVAQGIGKGDRVGLLAQNGIEYIDLLFACAKLGAIFAPYNFRLHPVELHELVVKTGPKAFVFGPEYEEHATYLRTHHTDLRTYLRTGHRATPDGTLSFEAVVTQGPLEGSPLFAPGEGPSGEDILCLLGTGGTTGLPKSAMISHRMVAHNSLTTMIHELIPGDVTVVHTPMFHTGGLFVYTVPLLTLGGTVVIMRKWTADDMLTLIEREKATVLFCVPTQYQMMMQSPKFASVNLSSLRFFTSGGAALPVPIIREYREKHGIVFKQGFGMTEFGPGIFSMMVSSSGVRSPSGWSSSTLLWPSLAMA